MNRTIVMGCARALGVGLLGLVLIPLFALAAATTFSSQGYSVGTTPQGVASGDFNGDSFLDLAVANLNSSTVSVLLNNGDGTYGAPTTLSLGTQLHDVKVADMNGDNKQDIIIESESNGGDVVVALGNGDGTFGPAISTTTSQGGASNVTVVDVNGDAKLDALVPFQDFGIIKILLGDGDGHFSTIHTISLAGGASSISLADMNGDNVIDLVLSHSADNDVGVMLGDGVGGFGAQATFTTGVPGGNAPVQTGDLNNDNKQDVVVATGSGVVMFFGNGDGTLGSPSVITAGSRGPVGVADFTGDGNMDVAVTDLSANIMFVLEGNGDGTFQESASVPTGAFPFPNGPIRDLNNDGKLDVAVPNLFGDSISVFLNTTVSPEITLQATADSFLRRGNPDRNEGANPRLRIQASGDNRAVVAFDEAAIDAFVAGGFTQATLVLTIGENADNWGTQGNRTVDAHALTGGFAEGNGQNAGVAGSESTRGTGAGTTWDCASDTNIANQQTNCAPTWNGGAFGAATAPAQLHVNNQTGEVSWDVTQDVLNGSFAWLIKKTNEGLSGHVDYYSKEGAATAGNPALAPRLILE